MRPESIDRLLPPMQCVDGCSECCGIVVASEPEYQRVMDYAADHGVTPRRQGSKCPWVGDDDRCTVHPARPTMCRIYGHVPGLECPRGRSVNVPLTVERRIMRNAVDETKASQTRFLHEAVYTADEISGLIDGEIADAHREASESPA